MANGNTRIYLKSYNPDDFKYIEDLIRKIGITEILSNTNLDLVEISFDHAALYNEKKITQILTSALSRNANLFFRARHYDDYGTEIFWLSEKGRCKKYQHDVDTEGEHIVKAYNHWHSGIGELWQGHFDKDEIRIMSERFGFYDASGKKTKPIAKNYPERIKGGESFLGRGITIPYASHEWDYHINVLQSYIAIIVAKSQYKPDDLCIKFERSFSIKNINNNPVIGFLWSWTFNDLQTVAILRWHGDLTTRVDILVNQHQLTIDELIFIDIFHKNLKNELIDIKTVVNDGYEQGVNPPCIDYLYNDIVYDRDKYCYQGIVISFTHIFLVKNTENRFVAVNGNVDPVFEIIDDAFANDINALGNNKYAVKDKDSLIDIQGDYICCELQVQFKGPKTVGRVLKATVYDGVSAKPIYRKDGSLPQPYRLPELL